jgi:predicted nucleic acid-binding protein
MKILGEMQRLIDTNLIIRYLVQDHDKHARAAGRLFDACDRGDVVIVVLPVVLAGCVFVLESFTGIRAPISPLHSDA